MIVVNGEDFRNLPYGERRALTGGQFNFWKDINRRKWASDGKPTEPYMLAFQVVVQRVLEICPPDAKVHLVFDINKDVEVAASRLVDQVKSWPQYERLGRIEFRDSIDFPGIQMADLHGYLLHRFIRFGQFRMGEEQAWALSQIAGTKIQYESLGSGQFDDSLEANPTSEHRPWLKGQVKSATR